MKGGPVVFKRKIAQTSTWRGTEVGRSSAVAVGPGCKLRVIYVLDNVLRESVG